MKPKSEQHAKENHTKIKLNYIWHLIFQKQDFVYGNFYVCVVFFFFLHIQISQNRCLKEDSREQAPIYNLKKSYKQKEWSE